MEDKMAGSRGRLGTVVGAVVLAGVLASVPWALSWRGAAEDAATPEVRAVLEEQVAAWNAHDLERFLKTYADDLTFYSGATVTKGLEPLAARYRKNYQSEGKSMGVLTFTDLDVSPLGRDRALARGRWKVEAEKTSEGLFTLLMRRRGGEWKIVHDHTSKGD